MKTLVYHDGGLGDTLLSVPCLHFLRRDSEHIHLVGRGDVCRFLKQAGVVQDASSSDHALFASLHSAVDPRLQTFLGRFDQAFVFTTQDQSVTAAAIGRIIPRIRIIRTIPPKNTIIQAARYRLAQLDPEERGLIDRARLDVPGESKTATRAMVSKAGYDQSMRLMALHPGSGGRMKCWPLERYFDVIERIQAAANVFVVMFTGEAEDEVTRKSVDAFTRTSRNRFHATNLDLLTGASLLTLSRLYIGNDSGFSHLAGLIGCPSVVLYGPTDPGIWKPLGPYVNILSTKSFGPISEITTDEVINIIESVSGKSAT